MSVFDREIFLEKNARLERHLQRVEERLPVDREALQPASDASDTVILHLWQAVQTVLDLGLASCVRLKLGTPADYGDAFRKLAERHVLDSALAERLVKAAGFRNVVAHMYDDLDMQRVWNAAHYGPADLRAFMTALARHIVQG